MLNEQSLAYLRIDIKELGYVYVPKTDAEQVRSFLHGDGIAFYEVTLEDHIQFLLHGHNPI